jgi:MarR family transcriptional regulator, organic hydroperoxide resistance regulator
LILDRPTSLMANLPDVGVLDAAPVPAGLGFGEGVECEQINMNGLENLLGYNLGTAYAALSFDLDPALRLIELTPKQTSILWLVEANPGITQSQLARLFRMRRATIHQMIASLTRKDLLTLAGIENDRRAQGLYITQPGREKLAEAQAYVDSMENTFSSVLTDAEFRMALQILQKLQGLARGG